jgi:hypothetical protein
VSAEKTSLSDAAGGGLKHLIEQSDGQGCETANRPYLKATDNERKVVYFIRPDCKMWGCAWCAEQRRKTWSHIAAFGGADLLRAGHGLSFVTLTSHRKNRQLAPAIRVWRDAWPNLSARWRRASPGVQYIYTSENLNREHFHVHIITTAPLPTRWYKDNSAETGLGYQAKAVPIEQAGECGMYMGKYLGKAIAVTGWPRGWRRVNTSRDWPKPEKEENPHVWLFLGNRTSRVRDAAMGYKSVGWAVETSLSELL